MKKNNHKKPRRKNKTYNPQKKTSLETVSLRLKKLEDEIEKNKQLAEMREQGLYNYISLMTNFASHDLKNAIHNLDGFVNTIDIVKFDQEDINSINEFINNIRKTISDFRTLAPDKTKSNFTIPKFGQSLDLLNRGLINANNIKINY